MPDKDEKEKKRKKSEEEWVEDFIALFLDVIFDFELYFSELLISEELHKAIIAMASDTETEAKRDSAKRLVDTLVARFSVKVSQKNESALKKSPEVLKGLSKTVVENTYNSKRYKAYYDKNGKSKDTENRIEKKNDEIVRGIQKSVENISHTTVVNVAYIQAIDKAIMAMKEHGMSYNDAVRLAIKEIGENGMQVQYSSGYRRRLDTAVRMNILEGYKKLIQATEEEIAKEVGCDAVEISAHPMSAPDHEPVQGRVFSKQEFEKLQRGQSSVDIDGKKHFGFPRQIMQWNCRHFVSPFSTEWSVRTYTDKELEKFEKENHEGCELAGKKYTLYQVTQILRGLETRIRQQKSVAVVAENAKDQEMRRECQRRINEYTKQYRTICNVSKIEPEYFRMEVQGFHRMNV